MLQTVLNTDALRGFDLELPLAPGTDNAEHVALLLHRVLKLVEEFSDIQHASAGDVVQALSVATALRAAMAEITDRTGVSVPAKLLGVEAGPSG
ncbi:hypothetical protein [Thiohalocapsa sp. ML1]|jgi:hypothetical protein|uniref:hypothetical protein n=1 Tax=Thiohalocapsa sp. ML1 TaxID=1431688 RepID=UPI000731F1D5|nr:hypothetical protein [Thiohalocapsa sp. ML1]